MILVASAIFIAIISYLIIPGLGGLRARSRWRRFRKRVCESALLAGMLPWELTVSPAE